MRFKPPRVAEILAGAFGALLLISLLLPWYGGTDECPQAPCPSVNQGAFQAFSVLDILLLAVALGGIGLLVAETTQRTPAVAVAWAALLAPPATVAAALVLWRTLFPPGAEAERLFVLLGLVASAGVAVAAWLSMRNDGLDRRRRAVDAERRPLPEPIRISSSAGGRPAGSQR